LVVPWHGKKSSSGKLVEKEIKGGNPAIPGNDEISPGVSWSGEPSKRVPLIKKGGVPLTHGVP
jgi:hypothetical protein